MKIGIATCHSRKHLSEDDRFMLSAFRKRSIETDIVIWNDTEVDWGQFDYLIIRSIWDYHLQPDLFRRWLDTLDEIGTKTLNPVSLIRSNMHKFYLRWLEETGVKIIPTLFVGSGDRVEPSFLDDLGWEKAVIKPAVSASAYLTKLVDRSTVAKEMAFLQAETVKRDWLIQKFIPEIQSFGELSMMFFNRRYSHTILKQASQGEFRVQSEYGGSTSLYKPSKATIEVAEDILSRFDGDILYTRVDGVMINDEFVLMEIELIEPHLFFNQFPVAQRSFIDAAIELCHKSV